MVKSLSDINLKEGFIKKTYWTNQFKLLSGNFQKKSIKLFNGNLLTIMQLIYHPKEVEQIYLGGFC